MKLKIQPQDYLILAAIASTTLHIIFRNLGRELGSFAFFWAPIVLVYIIFHKFSIFKWSSMKLLALYGLIVVGILQYFLWNYMNDWNRIRILFEFYYITIFTSILYYYLSRKEYLKLAWISKWTFVFTVISLITTNIALYLDPMILRESARSSIFTSYQSRIYNYTGSMGYSYLQAIVLLIPIIIYHLKHKIRLVFNQRLQVLVLIILLLTLVRSQYFANIAIGFLVTILSFLNFRKHKFWFIFIPFIGLLLFLVPNTFYSSIAISIGSYFDPNSDIHYKFNDLAAFIQNPLIDSSTGAGGRAERYPLLFKALINDPLFGNASNPNHINIFLGAHLYWMNRLALWGFLGFTFFIIVLYKLFSNILSIFKGDFRFYYLLSIVSFIFLGLTKAIGGSELWLMIILIIPGIYFINHSYSK